MSRPATDRKVRHMPRFLVSFVSFLIAIASFVAQISGDARTTELLAKARAALGGDSKLAKVQGLAASGALSRAVNESQITGEVTLELQLPDKMLRTDSV